jgi:hypothetical protein
LDWCRAVLLYLGVAAPLTLFHSFAAPPFQSPDEPAHFFRAVQISTGVLIGERRSDVWAGGEIDPNVTLIARQFRYVRGRSARIDPTDTAPFAVGWSRDPPVAVPFGNTAMYFPLFYMPSAAAVAIGRLTGATIIQTLYLARILDGVLALFISAAAVAIAAAARPLIFVLLSLPMTLALFGSCTQDAGVIATTGLVMAAWSGLDMTRRWCRVPLGFAVAALLGCVIAAKPPYLPLALLTLVDFGGARRQPGASWRLRLGCLAIAVIIPVFWIVVGLLPVEIELLPDQGVSRAGQLHFLLGHLAAIPELFRQTMVQRWEGWAISFVGVLGWLDTVLPRDYYDMSYAAIAAAAFLVAISEQRTMLGNRILAMLAIVLAGAGVISSQYFIWTPVGAPVIEGVQGRYFIPIAVALPLALMGAVPIWAWLSERAMRVVRGLGWTVIAVWSAASLWVVPAAILRRYYAAF